MQGIAPPAAVLGAGGGAKNPYQIRLAEILLQQEPPPVTECSDLVHISIAVNEASEVNALDLAAGPMPALPGPSFWHSLLAILGGVFAAVLAAAVGARFLFAPA